MSLRTFLHQMFPCPSLVRQTLRNRRQRRTENLEVRCLLAAVTWDGGAGTTNWDDANNWSNNLVPAAADDVTITSATVSLSTSVSLNSLTLTTATMNIGTTISIAADQMQFSSDSLVTAGINSMSLVQKTAGRAIDLGGAGSSSQVGLTDAELDRLTAATLTIGNSSSGAVTVSSAINHPMANLVIASGSGMTVSNAITMALDRNLTLNSTSVTIPISLNAAAADLVSTGVGRITVSSGQGIAMSTGATLSTVHGGISVASNVGSGGSGNYTGLTLDGAIIETIGTGNIDINGSGRNGGISLINAAQIRSTQTTLAAGTISIQASGGLVTATTPHGLALTGIGSEIRSNFGNITVNATAGVGSTISTTGILINSGAAIRSLGTGTGAAIITLTGNGGASVGRGIRLSNASTIQSIDGAVRLTGTGGSQVFTDRADELIGIEVETGSTIATNGVNRATAGSITLTGSGGGNGVSPGSYRRYHGVRVRDLNTTVSTVAGDISITGNGGGLNLSLPNNHNGVSLENSAVISTTGLGANSGNISISGVGGGINNPTSYGVFTGFTSRISTSGGSVDLLGQNRQQGDTDLYLHGAIDAAGASRVGLTANVLNLNTSQTYRSGGRFQIAPRTAGRSIILGQYWFQNQQNVTQHSGNSLMLTDAVIDRIHSPVLQLGDSQTGEIGITDVLSPQSATTLSLRSASLVSQPNRVTTGTSFINNPGYIAVNSLSVVGSNIFTSGRLPHQISRLAMSATESGRNALILAGGTGVLEIGTVDGVNGISTSGGDIAIYGTSSLSIPAGTNLIGNLVTLSGSDLVLEGSVTSTIGVTFYSSRGLNFGTNVPGMYGVSAEEYSRISIAGWTPPGNSFRAGGLALESSGTGDIVISRDMQVGAVNIYLSTYGSGDIVFAGGSLEQSDSPYYLETQLTNYDGSIVSGASGLDLRNQKSLQIYSYSNGGGGSVGAPGNPLSFDAENIYTDSDHNQYLWEENEVFAYEFTAYETGNLISLVHGEFDFGNDSFEDGYTWTFRVEEQARIIGNPRFEFEDQLINAGVISPGQSPGQLELDGKFAQEPTGVLEVEIGGLTPITQYDQIVLTNAGTSPLGGELSLSVDTAFAVPLGQQFKIIDVGTGRVSPFANVGEGGYISTSTTTFQISYSGGDGNDVVLTRVLAVSNTDNSGTGSLRRAIDELHVLAPMTFVPSIVFVIPGPGPHVINVPSPLQELARPVVLDGATQPGYAGSPLVEIRGDVTLADGVDGLVIQGDRSGVRGLSITNFTGSGIRLRGADSVTLSDVWLGFSSTEGRPLGNLGDGVSVDTDSSVEIQRAVISGNQRSGVAADPQSTGISIENSLIGLNSDGTQAVPNQGYGIWIVRDDSVTSDSHISVSQSTVSGNALGGLYIDDQRTSRNVLANFDVGGNRFGLNVFGTNAVSNGGFGVKLEGHHQLGYSPGESARFHGNTVSGNDGPGLWMENIGWWSIEDSKFGTDSTGAFAIPNDTGIVIRNYYGYEDFENLQVSGNRGDGIQIEIDDPGRSSDTEFVDLKVGTDSTGSVAIPNSRGISSHFAPGLTEDEYRYVYFHGQVSGNNGPGIVVTGTGAWNSSWFEFDAKIGTDSTGTEPLPNRGPGVIVISDEIETIIGNSTTIAFNRGPGVRHEGSGNGSNVVVARNSNNTTDVATFFGNQGLAIDLLSPGPTENSGAATDHPVITSATVNNRFLDVTGTNAENGGYYIQFYTTRPTVTNRGQGQTPVGTYGRLAGMAIPQAVLDQLQFAPEPLQDQDLRAGHFRYRIPVAPDFDSRLLTAVMIDPLYGYGPVPMTGISEFSPIVPIGTQITALPPVVDAGAGETMFAGQTLRRTVSFRDEDSVEFEVVVDYGDGGGFEFARYRPADRAIFLEHTYTRIGQFVISVSVLDDTQPIGLFDIDSFTVTVNDTLPEIRFNEVQLTKRIVEGETVNLQGLFDDAGIDDLHSVSVNWGDGTPEQSQTLPVGLRQFNLQHQYLDDGVSLAGSHVYRVVATVRDESGTVSATPVFLVEVDNVLPSALNVTLNVDAINEGGDVQLIGSFIDPGVLDTHAVYVNWGDGSPREKVSSSVIVQIGTHRDFQLSHTYVDDPTEGSQYIVTMDVADDDEPLSPVSSSNNTVTVANVAPVILPLLLGQSTIEENEAVALFVSFDDPGREAHTVSINWGDGHIEQFVAAPGAFSVTPSHRYLTDGTFTISATVEDRNVASTAETTTLLVTNLAPVALTPTPTPGNIISEGQTVTLTGSFSDDSMGEHYTVTVDWGDGTTTTFADTNSTDHTYSASHLYDDDPAGSVPAYNVTVSVNDGTDVVTTTTSVTVLNERPTVSVIPVIDTTTVNPVFRALGTDPSHSDQSTLNYVWSVTRGGFSLPFTYRNAYEIEVTLPSDGSGTPGSGSDPIPFDFPVIVSAQVADDDGGVSEEWRAKLFYGTSGVDILHIQDSDFGVDFRHIIVLGLGGNDLLDASNVTNSQHEVVLFGGAGDDQLFDGAGDDVSFLGDGNDSLNLPGTEITPNMGGNDEVYLVPNSTLTAYDRVGHNTLNFSLAKSVVTQANGVTFDLELTQRSTIVAQDVAPESVQAGQHFVAALGTFNKLVGSDYADKLTGASNSSVLGGLGADEFFTKDDITDATFGGGDDADVLTVRGLRVARVRFDGDDGADELEIDSLAEVFDTLEFSGGDDADVFVNRGRASRESSSVAERMRTCFVMCRDGSPEFGLMATMALISLSTKSSLRLNGKLAMISRCNWMRAWSSVVATMRTCSSIVVERRESSSPAVRMPMCFATCRDGSPKFVSTAMTAQISSSTMIWRRSNGSLAMICRCSSTRA